MKKLNKKGFTLIEMLVVIAIIAVLVAIIIPVVNSATDKAAAAANAANLRSIKAEVSLKMLGNDVTTVTLTKTGDTVTGATYSGNVSWKTHSAVSDTSGLSITISGSTVTCKYNAKTIAEWAALAG